MNITPSLSFSPVLDHTETDECRRWFSGKIITSQHFTNYFNFSAVPNFEIFIKGRTNKLVDGCYSFWQGGVFPLIYLTLREQGMSDSLGLIVVPTKV